MTACRAGDLLPLSCSKRFVPTPLPALLPITLNPVEPRPRAAAVVPAPHVKRPIGVDEGSDQLNHKRPQVDRLTDDLTVVGGVRGQVGVQLPGHGAGELD